MPHRHRALLRMASKTCAESGSCAGRNGGGLGEEVREEENINGSVGGRASALTLVAARGILYCRSDMVLFRFLCARCYLRGSLRPINPVGQLSEEFVAAKPANAILVSNKFLP